MPSGTGPASIDKWQLYADTPMAIRPSSLRARWMALPIQSEVGCKAIGVSGVRTSNIISWPIKIQDENYTNNFIRHNVHIVFDGPRELCQIESERASVKTLRCSLSKYRGQGSEVHLPPRVLACPYPAIPPINPTYFAMVSVKSLLHIKQHPNTQTEPSLARLVMQNVPQQSKSRAAVTIVGMVQPGRL
eukprot:1140847-Pelagomonas_calceolata.AAC.1